MKPKICRYFGSMSNVFASVARKFSCNLLNRWCVWVTIFLSESFCCPAGPRIIKIKLVSTIQQRIRTKFFVRIAASKFFILVFFATVATSSFLLDDFL